MVEPLVDAETNWVGDGDEKRLVWRCTACETERAFLRRYATARCRGCERIMQASDYDIDPRAPDPENPERYLQELARYRGYRYDEYYPVPESNSGLDW